MCTLLSSFVGDDLDANDSGASELSGGFMGTKPVQFVFTLLVNDILGWDQLHVDGNTFFLENCPNAIERHQATGDGESSFQATYGRLQKHEGIELRFLAVFIFVQLNSLEQLNQNCRDTSWFDFRERVSTAKGGQRGQWELPPVWI